MWGTDAGTGCFALSQFGITSARASGYNVWTGRTTTFNEASVTLEAGQTLLMQIKGI